MSSHEPLSPRLDDMEAERLKEKILIKRTSRKRHLRMVLILAAAMSLLAACGAAVLGCFDTMTGTNDTGDLTEIYGLNLENPPCTTVDGHTVTVQAVIRSDNMARVIYDITGSQSEVSAWQVLQGDDGTFSFRIQFLPGEASRSESGQPAPHKNFLRQTGYIGETSGGDSSRWFADIDLPLQTDSLDILVLSGNTDDGCMSVSLPPAVPDLQTELTDANIVLPSSNGEGDDITVTIRHVQITPFRLTLEGTYRTPSDYSSNIDPAQVYEIEIAGTRYPLR